VTPQAAALTWMCEVCDMSIADEDGYVTMSFAELHEFKRATKAWDERIDAKYPGPWRAYPMSELSDLPNRVRWRVLHRNCDAELESPAYWIAVERIRSAGDVISWSSHLLEKNWIQETSGLLRDIASQLDKTA
jgi:hypothetical protein